MPRNDHQWVSRTSEGKFVETFDVKSARSGLRLAEKASSSAQERAAYSKEVVQDGRDIAQYVIEKRTRKYR